MKFFNFRNICLSFAILVTLIFVSLLNARPVLVEWYSPFGAICEPPYVVLNPLRNREAEKVANGFIEKLKFDQLEILNDIIKDKENLEHIKQSESKSKIKTWFVGSRSQNNDKASFTYWIEREFEGGCQSMPTNIELERFDGIWKIVGFSPTY